MQYLPGLTMLLLLMLMLLGPALTLPTIQLPTADQYTVATDTESSDLLQYQNSLTKRHDYTLICQSLQDPKQPHLGKYDDVALTKRCARSPHKYTCDSAGEPDVNDGGKTDPECDKKCECRNIGTNPKPYCVGVLGVTNWGTCL